MEKQKKQKTQHRNEQQDQLQNLDVVSKREDKQPVPQPKDYEDIEY
ncbi:hypothetical protein [Alkalihalobacillus sp. BA299]|nr:hypothetical protein [Alkalihalobacillus sp. BA299]